jgi:hypothetical protein
LLFGEISAEICSYFEIIQCIFLMTCKEWRFEFSKESLDYFKVTS